MVLHASTKRLDDYHTIMPSKKILILSTGNSVRSQMAEGWMRYYAGKHAEIFSAGSEKNRGINKLAHHVMMESVIDIGAQTSDRIDRYLEQTFDHVILLDKQAEAALTYIKYNEHHLYEIEDPLIFKTDKNLMVQKFIEVRNQLDDLSFNFVNQYIRNIIPPL